MMCPLEMRGQSMVCVFWSVQPATRVRLGRLRRQRIDSETAVTQTTNLYETSGTPSENVVPRSATTSCVRPAPAGSWHLSFESTNPLYTRHAVRIGWVGECCAYVMRVGVVQSSAPMVTVETAPPNAVPVMVSQIWLPWLSSALVGQCVVVLPTSVQPAHKLA